MWCKKDRWKKDRWKKDRYILFKSIRGISFQFLDFLGYYQRCMLYSSMLSGKHILAWCLYLSKQRHKPRQTGESKYWGVLDGQPRSHTVFPNPGPPPLKLLLFTSVLSSDCSLISLFPPPTMLYEYQKQVFQGFVVASAVRKQHDGDSSSFPSP